MACETGGVEGILTVKKRLSPPSIFPLAPFGRGVFDDVTTTSAEASPAFARLREELRAYTATPTGVGLDVPFWLRRLELEVHRAQATHTTLAALAENFFRVPQVALSYDAVQEQLRGWERPALPQ